MRVAGVLAMRAADQNWADSVAGDMERHYSPGRTWEALARSVLPLFETGDVLDIASGDGVLAELLAPHRSEEHTSELQSLMRLSYAVFCLKKKKTRITQSD